MEIVNPNVCALSNFEVMELLNNIKDTKKKRGLRNVATIQYETLQYLNDAPCKYQSHESIAQFLKEIKPYNLSNNECLMIVNNPPETALHIQLIVEDSEARLTEEQVEEILAIVAKFFPGAPKESE